MSRSTQRELILIAQPGGRLPDLNVPCNESIEEQYKHEGDARKLLHEATCYHRTETITPIASTFPVLIKRFSFDRATETSSKIRSEFEIADQLKFGDDRQMLLSIILHHGDTIAHGHYTCLVRVAGGWVDKDDLRIRMLQGSPLGLDSSVGRYVAQNAYSATPGLRT